MAWTDWRRWIATLCVALIAFVMVEQCCASDACLSGGPASYDISELAFAAQGGDEQPGSPPAPGQAQQHCCAAHAVAVPQLHQSQAIDQVAIRLSVARSDGRAPSGEQGGQDRPPRTSTLV